MKNLLMSIALTSLMATGVFAGPKTYKNQQKRIAQGVRSGQLTPRETARLESKERAINSQIRAERKANGGNLTDAQKAQVRSERQAVSKDIYAQKHDAQKDHFGKSEVGQRQENQQDRIANGIQSGKLNANEAAHLENRETAIQQEVHDDRTANGGKLTGAERRKINREQNRVSEAIKTEKHD